jgi:hypothetical protein
MAPSVTSGLSLWLSPPPSSRLNAFLVRLSSSLQTVAFSSHATLVSDELVPSLEIPDLVARIRAGIDAWSVAEGGASELPLTFHDVRQGEEAYSWQRGNCS